MKRLLALLLVLCCLAPLASAYAASQTSWNQSCVKKLVASAKTYAWSDEEHRLVSIGTASAGSYIKQHADDDVCRQHGVARISWCTPDGNTHTAYIYPSVITSATASVKLNNGKSVTVPEALLTDTTALYKYLWTNYESGMRSQAAHTGAAAAAKANDPGFSVEYAGDSGDLRVVNVRELGLAWTDVLLGSTPMSVHTADLFWTTEADPDASLAVIYAPKSGKASMYAKKDAKSTVIKKCQAGKIVLVLAKGSNYARIWYDGQIGYVLTSVLNFYGPADADALHSAALIYKGKTNGRARVNVRQTATAKGRIVCQPLTGTEVIVTSMDGKWAEVDVNGYHGFVQTKYLELLN